MKTGSRNIVADLLSDNLVANVEARKHYDLIARDAHIASARADISPSASSHSHAAEQHGKAASAAPNDETRRLHVNTANDHRVKSRSGLYRPRHTHSRRAVQKANAMRKRKGK